ncbi:MAG: ABC transporter permease [Sedimentisphaerales bacterium]|nr:ABC transporter permease [Sedimentisphaerales bacterium]
MNKVCQIGHNDLKLFLRHKSSYVWLFGIPLLFVYFIGLANKGSRGPAQLNPQVAIENADQGPLGAFVCRMLEGQGLKIVGPNETHPAVARIRIQQDFTAKVTELEQARIELVYPTGLSDAHVAIIKARLVRASIAINGLIIQVALDKGLPLTAQRIMEVAARPQIVTLQARFAGCRPIPTGFYFSLPGTTVMYLIMNLLIFGGSTLAQERQSGLIKRLAALPISQWQLILGKVYGLILLGMVQIAFFLAAGMLLFGVRIGSNLPGVLLVLVALA